jgi:hypothetical protein
LLQASIVKNHFAICKLQLFIAFVYPDHDGRSVTKFMHQLHPSRWVISRTTCLFPDYGNSVIGNATVIVGVHNSTQSKVEPLLFKTPPICRPLTLLSFIWPPFNKTEYQLSYAMNNASFMDANANGTVALMPPPSIMALFPSGLKVLCHLHLCSNGPGSLNGSTVLSLDSLCLPFDSSPNTNLI